VPLASLMLMLCIDYLCTKFVMYSRIMKEDPKRKNKGDLGVIGGSLNVIDNVNI